MMRKSVDEAVNIERALRGTEKGYGAAVTGVVPVVGSKAGHASK